MYSYLESEVVVISLSVLSLVIKLDYTWEFRQERNQMDLVSVESFHAHEKTHK